MYDSLGLGLMRNRKLLRMVLLVFASVLAFVGQTHAQKRMIPIVEKVISSDHLVKPSVDEAYCKRWLDEYLRILDPSKRYFLKEDIREFEGYIRKLPALAKSGDTELLVLISQRYRRRASTALKHAISRVARDFDFGKDEAIPLEYNSWPRTIEERNDRWRLQLKYDLLVECAVTEDLHERVEFIKSRYSAIADQVASLTQEQSVGYYLDSFCRVADSHSSYLTETQFSSFQGGMLREYTIGLALRTVKGRTAIQSVEAGFHHIPGAESALGCELVAIQSQKGNVYHFREIDPFATDQLIRRGLRRDDFVVLELFDEIRQRRFRLRWPRKEIER